MKDYQRALEEKDWQIDEGAENLSLPIEHRKAIVSALKICSGQSDEWVVVPKSALEQLVDGIESVARDMRRIESGECSWGKGDASMFASNIEHDVKQFRKSMINAAEEP